MDQNAFRQLVTRGGKRQQDTDWLNSEPKGKSKGKGREKRPRSESNQAEREDQAEAAGGIPKRSRVTGEAYIDRAAARRAGEADLDDGHASDEPSKPKGIDFDLLRAERERLARAARPDPDQGLAVDEELEAAFQGTAPALSEESMGASLGAAETQPIPKAGFKPITSRQGTTADGIPLDEDGKPMYKIVNGKRMRRKRKRPPAETGETKEVVALRVPHAKPVPTPSAPAPSAPQAAGASTLALPSKTTSKDKAAPHPTHSWNTSSPVSDPRDLPIHPSRLEAKAPLVPRNVKLTAQANDPAQQQQPSSSPRSTSGGTRPSAQPQQSAHPPPSAQPQAQPRPEPRSEPQGVSDSGSDSDSEIFAGAGEWAGPTLSDSDSDAGGKEETEVASTQRDWFGDRRSADPPPHVPENPVEADPEADRGLEEDRPVPEPEGEELTVRPMRLEGLSSSALPQAVTRAMLEEEVQDRQPKDRPQRVHKRSRKGKGGYGSD